MRCNKDDDGDNGNVLTFCIISVFCKVGLLYCGSQALSSCVWAVDHKSSFPSDSLSFSPDVAVFSRYTQTRLTGLIMEVKYLILFVFLHCFNANDYYYRR